jgi:hypothetical protein
MELRHLRYFLAVGPLSVPDWPSWWEKTPEDFRALGWTYVPWADAPKPLRKTLKDGGEIALAVDNYEGHELLFLNGGLNGKLFYYGVALTPAGKESRARVGRISNPFPIRVRLSLDDSLPCRCNLAQNARPNRDRGLGLAWFGRNGASLNRQVQTTISFIQQPDLSAHNVRTSHSPGEKLVQQALQ